MAAPARHGWTPRDLNQLVTDWLGVGHWIPDSPHKPIGLLGAILAWHGLDNLDQRPACYDDARYAESFGAAGAIVEDERAADAEAADIVRQALAGPGRTQVGQQLALIRARSAQRRAAEVAAQIAQLEAHVAVRRGVPHRGRDRP